MVDYIASPSRLGRYLKDPRGVYYYFNKAIRKPSIRNLFFKAIRIFVPKYWIYKNVSQELSLLSENGVIFWDSLIDPPTVERIRQFLLDKPVYDVRDIERKTLQLSKLDAQKPMKLKFFDKDIAQSGDIVRLVNREHILALVASYLGCKPTITIIEAWWTKAGAESANVLFQDDMYHRDVEDFKFIKLFVYLTDVAENNGAHCFIKGSQRSEKLIQRMPISDDLVHTTFGANESLVLTGSAGCGFLEDTWGLHRSLPIQTGKRLLLSVTYSLTSFNPYSPKLPVAQNRYGVDPFINRVYLS